MKFINLKQLRKERGLTQEQLGKALKLPQSTISYLENGLQEVTDFLLKKIKQTFSIDNLDGYVYERKTFHEPKKTSLERETELAVIFNKDWDRPTPVDNLEGFPIVCKTGRIGIAMDGSLVIDRNMGIGYLISCYVVSPEKFVKEDLLLSITSKEWLDLDMFEDFKRAYYIGCRIAGIPPVKQLKEAVNQE